MIEIGDIFWLRSPIGREADSGIAHPHVVLQATALNASRIDTIVVCALSTNMKNAYCLGNVALDDGEGNLPTRSYVAVGQVGLASKKDFKERIGRLERHRIEEILEGVLQRALANAGRQDLAQD